MKTLLTLTLTLALGILPALAQELTSDEVDRFLNSLEKLNDLPETEKEPMTDLEMDPEYIQEKMTSPFTSSLKEMRGHEMYAKGLAIIKSEGFSDDEEWASVGDRMMRAYAALKMGDVEPEMDAKMAEALENLEKSDLPEEMKAKMREAMDASKGMVKTMQDVPPEDVKAVEPHVERLEKMGETAEEG